MIIGLGKRLEYVRTILSNSINDIIVCQDMLQVNSKEYYTLIRVFDDNKIKDILESIYDVEGACKLPSELFVGIFVSADTLNILMKYKEPRKLFSYLKSDMRSDYSQHMIIKNFLFECLKIDTPYSILNLMLDSRNINLTADNQIFFNGFLDFNNFDKNATEEQCVKKCSNLINDILLSDELLTQKSDVKSIKLFKKKRRNDNYDKFIQLYNDFKIEETIYNKDREGLFNRFKEKIKYLYESRIWKLTAICGSILIAFSLILFICNLFNLDLPFTKYKGMNIIGTVNMTERVQRK